MWIWSQRGHNELLVVPFLPTLLHPSRPPGISMFLPVSGILGMTQQCNLSSGRKNTGSQASAYSICGWQYYSHRTLPQNIGQRQAQITSESRLFLRKTDTPTPTVSTLFLFEASEDEPVYPLCCTTQPRLNFTVIRLCGAPRELFWSNLPVKVWNTDYNKVFPLTPTPSLIIQLTLYWERQALNK